jgi:hypothetical protein
LGLEVGYEAEQTRLAMTEAMLESGASDELKDRCNRMARDTATTPKPQDHC